MNFFTKPHFFSVCIHVHMKRSSHLPPTYWCQQKTSYYSCGRLLYSPLPSTAAATIVCYHHCHLSWKCRHFRCRQQLVLKTFHRVFPTWRPDMADVSATSWCDVGFFFSVSYVMSLPTCRHVVVVTTNHSTINYFIVLYVTTHTNKKTPFLPYRSICYAGIVQTDGPQGSNHPKRTQPWWSRFPGLAAWLGEMRQNPPGTIFAMGCSRALSKGFF